MPELIQPLFVFGTLLDRDVQRLVLGEVFVRQSPAVLANHRAVRLPDETYPVLVPAVDEDLSGMVLFLPSFALERVGFYEGDEYGFEQVSVKATDGSTMDALVCADRAIRTGARIPWSLADWQRHHKAEFLPFTREYMALFGTMTTTEADAIWRAMTVRTQ